MASLELTDRQQREIEYHKGHAAHQAFKPIDLDVLYSPVRRWWNAYWDTWTYLTSLDLKGKAVLVVGCGAGDDALLFAKLGAKVSAFDLSPDMLAIARDSAAHNNLAIDFGEMPSERLTYRENTFDLIFARDILHHVEIPQTMREVARVAKPGALFVANEIYSHSVTDRLRHAGWVENLLYPRVQKIIYRGSVPYITEDERKMTELDIGIVKDHLVGIEREKYFNFLVRRLMSDRSKLFCKIDRAILKLAGGGAGKFMGGRIVLVGKVVAP